MMEILSFTLCAKGRPRTIATQCYVYSTPKTKPVEAIAVWDTGATCSVISHNVALALGLKPEGELGIQTIAGAIEGKPYYYVDIVLPGNIIVPQIRVIEGITDDCDVLIGMDIIMTGDLAITHKDDNTTFTFQMPSTHHIDFQNK